MNWSGSAKRNKLDLIQSYEMTRALFYKLYNTCFFLSLMLFVEALVKFHHRFYNKSYKNNF